MPIISEKLDRTPVANGEEITYTAKGYGHGSMYFKFTPPNGMHTKIRKLPETKQSFNKMTLFFMPVLKLVKRGWIKSTKINDEFLVEFYLGLRPLFSSEMNSIELKMTYAYLNKKKGKEVKDKAPLLPQSDRDVLLSKINSIIENDDMLLIEGAKVTFDTEITSDTDWIHLIMNIEREFDVAIPDEQLTTIGGVINFLLEFEEIRAAISQEGKERK